MSYPVTLQLRGRRCIVLGERKLAAEKARGLLRAGAQRRVPTALERLVAQYREERSGGELFAQWVERADRDAVKARLADLALSDAPTAEEIVDWDQDTAFTGKTGEGECAVKPGRNPGVTPPPVEARACPCGSPRDEQPGGIGPRVAELRHLTAEPAGPGRSARGPRGRGRKRAAAR